MARDHEPMAGERVWKADGRQFALWRTPRPSKMVPFVILRSVTAKLLERSYDPAKRQAVFGGDF